MNRQKCSKYYWWEVQLSMTAVACVHSSSLPLLHLLPPSPSAILPPLPFLLPFLLSFFPFSPLLLFLLPRPQGFITMTPQLFINYKLKSVAHLPWRMLTYKALNTFIDDMFAFVIKMPTMYRIGCFRDGKPTVYLHPMLLLVIAGSLC